jgi:hypothetical protein
MRNISHYLAEILRHKVNPRNRAALMVYIRSIMNDEKSTMERRREAIWR